MTATRRRAPTAATSTRAPGATAAPTPAPPPELGDPTDVGPTTARSEAIGYPGIAAMCRAWRPPPVRSRPERPPNDTRVRMPPGFNADAFEAETVNFPNPELRRYVVTGLREGFDTLVEADAGYDGFENSNSAYAFQTNVDEWVDGEIAAKRYVEIDPADWPDLYITPLGTAPKRSYVEGVIKRRITCDESRRPPGRRSLNDSIDKGDIPVDYIGIQDVVDAALAFGVEAHFIKVDIRSAFRNLPKHPSVRHLHALRWQDSSGRDRTFLDLSINFGCRSSPFCFESVMPVLEWILQRNLDADPYVGEGNVEVRHFCDDLGVVCRNKPLGDRAFDVVRDLYRRLGIPTSDEKSEPPTQAGEYLGLWLDFRRQQLQLPPDKRSAYQADVKRLLAMPHRQLVPVRELESVCGRLEFAASVHRLGRTYLRGLYAVRTTAENSRGRRARLTARAKDDLGVWTWLLDPDGAPAAQMFQSRLPVDDDKGWPVDPPDDGEDWCVGDASGAVGASDGFGYYWADGHSFRPWTNAERRGLVRLGVDKAESGESSTRIETLCFVSAVEAFIARCDGAPRDRTFRYFCDNRGVEANWTAGRSRTKPINDLLRTIAARTIELGLTVVVRWRPRTNPWIAAADELSHGRSQAASILVPRCRRFVTPGSVRGGTGV